MAQEAAKVGILAGGGSLPIEVADGLAKRQCAYHVVGFEGFVDADVSRHPHTLVNLGQLGRVLRTFRRQQCADLVILGTLARPDLTKLRLDFGAFQHAFSVLQLTRGGDDHLLRGVVRFFEGQGFRVRGVGDLVPELLAPLGAIAGASPDQQQHAAIAVARAALADLSHLDLGQAVVASSDGIDAFEDGGGTARMLARLASAGGAAPGSVLVKLAKIGQELRVDAPTIGAATVAQAAAAGLTTIAVGAGTTLVAERAALDDAARAHGVSVVGVPSLHQDQDSQTGNPRDPDHRYLADDLDTARTIAAACARHARPGYRDIGIVVRRGHVMAVMIDALAEDHWARRLTSLPRGWQIPVLLPRRAGVLLIALTAADRRTTMSAWAQIIDAARTAGLAQIAIDIRCDQHAVDVGNDAPDVDAIRHKARAVGLAFTHMNASPP
ncbi:MAG: UDP-2,3-diacylglucosamine diphosphatase LpxI [Pseudomonadota bacterium]